MSAEQIRVMSITDDSMDYAEEINKKLLSCGIRSKLDLRNEKIGYKIREASNYKVPYMILVGKDEKENQTISYRARKNVQENGVKLDDFIAKIKQEIKTFAR